MIDGRTLEGFRELHDAVGGMVEAAGYLIKAPRYLGDAVVGHKRPSCCISTQGKNECCFVLFDRLEEVADLRFSKWPFQCLIECDGFLTVSWFRVDLDTKFRS